MIAVIKGAGDIASGVAYRMHQIGFSVVMTDLNKPTSIRRTVCFSEAIINGSTTIENVTAEYAKRTDEIEEIISNNHIAVLADPEAKCIKILKPEIVIDAIMAKKNLSTSINDAPIVIALGPGFCAGKDCHAVIETMRGHNLGRIYYNGEAEKNTGIPGSIMGYTTERILRAPKDGIFNQVHQIGDIVEKDEICAYVDDLPVKSNIAGVLRGILPSGTEVYKGMKSGDVDPRSNPNNCITISDKANAVGAATVVAAISLSDQLKEYIYAL